MKKMISGIALYLCLTVAVNAQLGGTYEVGDGGDYTNLKAAFDDLMEKGVNGDVTFLITSDLTEPENVALGIDPGSNTITIKPAPATTPVVTFTQTTGNSVYNGAFIIGLTDIDGGGGDLTLTRNIIFDGSNTVGGTTRDLTLQTAPGAGNANTFRFIGDTENVEIRNTNILWNQTGNAFNTVQITSRSDSQHQNLLFENNYIENSSSANSARAIMTDGIVSASVGPELIIRDNEMVASRYGVWLREVGGPTIIEGNSFSINQGTTLVAYGVFVEEIADPSHVIVIRNNTVENSGADGDDFYAVSAESPAVYEIIGNTFENLSAASTLFGVNIAAAGTYEISGNFFNGFSGDGGVEMISFENNIVGDHTATISNNFLTGFASGGNSGQDLFGIIVRSPEGSDTVDVEIYHNTIVLNPITVSGSGWAYRGISLFSNPRISAELRNNIIINADDNGSNVLSYAYYQAGSAAAGFNSDFNLWYVENPAEENTRLSRHGAVGTNTTTLAGHQSSTGDDANSVSKSVEFVNAGSGNLRLTAASNGDQDLAGTPLAEVTTDIDGEPRNPHNPYMGAFEGRPLSPMVVIRGSEGYRLMSVPTNETLASLLDPIWTQGAAGSNFPSTPYANVFTYTETGYEAIDDLNTIPGAGSGFAIFVYDEDEYNNPDSAVWPKVLTLTGTQNTGAVSVPVNTAPDAFTLAGNPYFSAIDFNELSRTDIRNQVFVYSHSFEGPFDLGDDTDAGDAGGGWRTWNGTAGSLTDGIIAPFQGFFVRNESAVTTPALNITEDAKVDDAAEFYDVLNPRRHIQIAGLFNNSRVSDVWLSFTEYGSAELNQGDLPSLYPLDHGTFLSIYAGADGEALDIKNLPDEIASPIQVPIYVEAWKLLENNEFQAAEGFVELIWPEFSNIPEYWDIELHDNETGDVIDLRRETGYTFELSFAERSFVADNTPELKSLEISAKSAARFSLTVSSQATSAGSEENLPREFSLSQNYPNPFNPTTSIRYSLPETAEVVLDVFNIQGQRVARLVNGRQQAGEYAISFDASRLASGIYIYRLKAGNQTLSRKMTLIK